MTAVICLLLVACSNDELYEKAAVDYCSCVQPLMDASKNTAQQLDSGVSVEELKNSFQASMQEMRTCMQSMATKYAEYEQDATFKSEVQKRLLKHCPGPEGLLKGG